jgi:hypothetical protein
MSVLTDRLSQQYYEECSDAKTERVPTLDDWTLAFTELKAREIRHCQQIGYTVPLQFDAVVVRGNLHQPVTLEALKQDRTVSPGRMDIVVNRAEWRVAIIFAASDGSGVCEAEMNRKEAFDLGLALISAFDEAQK